TKIQFSLSWRNEHVREIIKRFNPTILGRGVVQLSGYFDLVLASLLVTGAVSALMSAQVLYMLPISLFAMSIAAAELPEMSRNTNIQDLTHRLNQGIKQTSFFMFLTSVIYITIGDQIIGVIFQWGSFDRDDSIVVAVTLAAYSLGIPAIGISRIYQSAFYASGDTKTPAFSATLRVVISLILGLLLMFPLDRFFISNSTLEKVPGSITGDRGPLSESLRALPANPHLGAAGLAVGSAAAAWIEMLFLSRKINKKITPNPSPLSPIMKLLPAALSSVIISIIARWLLSNTNELINCLVCVPVAVFIYIVISSKSGVKESSLLLKGLRRNLQKLKFR
ncbi:MAG TPA: lipid II flippase MurJ, partial [Acidimicrobiales bacterium]|nr:lipid II flippase MurJ [Acidimicrobiales bacterium]